MHREPNLPNEFFRPNQSAITQLVAIDKLVQRVLESHESKLAERNIVIETDLSSVLAVADSRLIQTAFGALIDNANQLMRKGGELSITLIDGKHQWELEVADDVERFPTSQEELDLMFSEQVGTNDVPSILPFPGNKYLQSAYRAALLHGGQLQMWDCPTGGTAHVLVIPKRSCGNARFEPAES